MKKILFLALMLGFGIAWGQPNLINYQGVMLGSTGTPIANKAIRFRLTILDGNSPSVSSGIYSESHSVTTTASGLFQFQIGGGTVENGNFSSIPWSDNQKYVKLEVDTNGGTNYKHFATSQLVSVPFALAAGSAGTAGSTSSIKDQNGTPYTVSTQNGSPTLVATGGGSVLAGCGADFLYKDQYYSTVVINGQCWMAENLNVGSMITTSTTQANNGLFEKYCYGNDPAKCSQFGGLYQWAEAMDYKSSATNTSAPNPVFQDFVQGICPKGWHIPTYEDFLGLKDLYPTNVSASLRSSNNLWYTPGTNESNFNLLPAGNKLGTGSGFLLSSTGLWYSHSTTNANTNYLWSISTGSNSFTSPTKTDGYSVRCVKNGCIDVQAFAGQDFLQICNDSVQLAALDPGNGLKGRWTVKSGQGGYFSNINDPNAYFKTSQRGTKSVLAWTVNGCTTSSDEMEVQFTTKANAGYDQLNVCDTNVILQANAVSNGETGFWTISSGIGGYFEDDQKNNSKFSGNYGTEYQLVWNINSADGSCPNTDTVIISFNKDIDNPIDAGLNITGVNLGDSLHLNGSSVGTNENGYWSSNTNTYFSNYGSNISKALVYGCNSQATLYWQVSNRCFVRKDSILVQFNSPATTKATVPDVMTSNTRVVNLVGNAYNTNSEIVQWNAIDGPSYLQLISDRYITNPTVTISNFDCNSDYRYEYIITNKACPDSVTKDTIKVQYRIPTNLPVLGSDVSGITSDTLVINNTGMTNASEENYSWYTYIPSTSTTPPLNTIDNGTFRNSSASKSTLARNCKNNYFAVLQVSPKYCYGSYQKYDTVWINFSNSVSQGAISAGTNQTVPGQNYTILQGTALNSPFVGTWTLVSRTPANAQYYIENPNQNNSRFSGEFGATYSLRWTATNYCGATNPSSSTVTINFTNPMLNGACPGVTNVTFDNRVYRTVQIGDQCWMKDNMNSGTKLNVPSQWFSPPNTSGIDRYCPSDDTSLCAQGAYYTWDEAIQNPAAFSNNYRNLSQSQLGFVQGVCPTGWHVPSIPEFSKLNQYLGIVENFSLLNTANLSINSGFTSSTLSPPKLWASGTSGFESEEYTQRFDLSSWSWVSEYGSIFWTISDYENCNWNFGSYSCTYDNGYGFKIPPSWYTNVAATFLTYPKGNALKVRCLKD